MSADNADKSSGSSSTLPLALALKAQPIKNSNVKKYVMPSQNDKTTGGQVDDNSHFNKTKNILSGENIPEMYSIAVHENNGGISENNKTSAEQVTTVLGETFPSTHQADLAVVGPIRNLFTSSLISNRKMEEMQMNFAENKTYVKNGHPSYSLWAGVGSTSIPKKLLNGWAGGCSIEVPISRTWSVGSGLWYFNYPGGFIVSNNSHSVETTLPTSSLDSISFLRFGQFSLPVEVRYRWANFGFSGNLRYNYIVSSTFQKIESRLNNTGNAPVIEDQNKTYTTNEQLLTYIEKKYDKSNVSLRAAVDYYAFSNVRFSLAYNHVIKPTQSSLSTVTNTNEQLEFNIMYRFLDKKR